MRRFFTKERSIHSEHIPWVGLVYWLRLGSPSGVGDPILGLGMGVKCINLSECGQESFLGHQIGVAIGNATSFKHKNSIGLWQSGGQRTTGSATSYNYIVIVILRWKVFGVEHKLYITWIWCRNATKMISFFFKNGSKTDDKKREFLCSNECRLGLTVLNSC